MFSFNSALVAKTREAKDEQLCIVVHIRYNTHDTDPLDTQDNKGISKRSKHCLT